MRGKSFIVLAIGILLFCSVGGYATTASFQGLGHLQGDGSFYHSRAYNVSADGSVVVGYSVSASGDEPFRWTAEDGMQGLGGWCDQFARGVSADGAVVVGDGENGITAFRWTEEEGMKAFDALPGWSYNKSFGISDNGLVAVGYSDSVLGTQAVRWVNNVAIGLGDLPGGDFYSMALAVSADGSVIVGMGTSDLGREAFRWENGVMSALGLPAWSNRSFAQGISADGSVVVGNAYYNGTSKYEAFRWEDGIMTWLGGMWSVAYDVSTDGSVVVGRYSGAFIWDEVNGMRNLQDLLVNEYGLDLTGWTLREATGISDDGLTIVGYGMNPDGYDEAFIVTIPEPGTVLLLGLGGLFLRRKRNKT